MRLVRPTFARTESDGIVGPIHENAIPVLIRTKDAAEQWIEALPGEALQLEKSAPDDAILLVPEARKA
ncbi:hypothetical protein [Reyranella sp.]|uniref:hypothetical protein n=1 Tax=Reyranella sp. TaxID=1929291 RepID=UPI0040373747